MRYLLVILFLFSTLFATTDFVQLSQDLQIARYYDEKLCERFPVTYNYVFSTGYFVTPSARMTDEGFAGFGFASHYPYYNWNGRVQPLPRLELSVNYRIFRGVEDLGMSSLGFGDYADRGANFKIALLTPEESMNNYPGFAFGIEDFVGSKKFTTYFFVGTQIWTALGLETSFGWGAGRYTKGPSKGFFGGLSWFPWWQSCRPYIRGVGLIAEYDPIDYTNPEREPNPHGRTTHSPINVGLTYNYRDLFTVCAGQIRGEALSASATLSYNFGKSEGFFPKTKNPPLYTAPQDHEPLGCSRPEKVLIEHLQFAFTRQGFQIIAVYFDEKQARLWLTVNNCRYIHEEQTRKRLQHLLAALLPSNVEEVVLSIESYGIPCQQYTYSKMLLQRYINCHIHPYEFEILTPREDSVPPSCSSQKLYTRRYDLWRAALYPSYDTFIGNRHGKFKYSAGLNLFAEGFLPGKIFYKAQANYQFASTMKQCNTGDFYNPSKLQNVATDIAGYINQGALIWPNLYAQRAWNLGRGFFTRSSLGYFQVNYGGVAGEVLWYPAQSYCALGIEGAILKKRRYRGFGFQDKVRRLKNGQQIWRPYSIFDQYFLNAYLDFPQYQLFIKASVGGFLAQDKGGRIELMRYFDNGIRFGGWMTFTNAADVIHGVKYYNRGVCLEFPLDFLYRKSCKKIYSTAIAAWLRDAGYYSFTGEPLYETINRERRW